MARCEFCSYPDCCSLETLDSDNNHRKLRLRIGRHAAAQSKEKSGRGWFGKWVRDWHGHRPRLGRVPLPHRQEHAQNRSISRSARFVLAPSSFIRAFRKRRKGRDNSRRFSPAVWPTSPSARAACFPVGWDWRLLFVGPWKVFSGPAGSREVCNYYSNLGNAIPFRW